MFFCVRKYYNLNIGKYRILVKYVVRIGSGWWVLQLLGKIKVKYVDIVGIVIEGG